MSVKRSISTSAPEFISLKVGLADRLSGVEDRSTETALGVEATGRRVRGKLGVCEPAR